MISECLSGKQTPAKTAWSSVTPFDRCSIHFIYIDLRYCDVNTREEGGARINPDHLQRFVDILHLATITDLK